jgi:glutamine cyclotransferase
MRIRHRSLRVSRAARRPGRFLGLPVGLSHALALAAALLAWTAFPVAPVRAAELLDWELVSEHPHDPRAYTQGLVWSGDQLFESTGLVGRSSLRRVDPASGRVLASRTLPAPHFGEGLALVDRTLIQLTWTSGLARTFDHETFAPRGEFHYQGQGWGLAFDGRRLVMSNGTDWLTFRDPRDFSVLGRVRVVEEGRATGQLNELEWAEGFVLCNVWHEDQVLVADPDSGRVAARLDFAPLRRRMSGYAEVLNGLAFDPESRRLWVTGKLWPRLFAVRVPAWPSRSPRPEK